MVINDFQNLGMLDLLQRNFMTESVYEPLIYKAASGIKIKKQNQGKFTDYCGGKVTDKCIQRGKNSSDPAIRKRAVFAQNARAWKHQNGGTFMSYDPSSYIPPITMFKPNYGDDVKDEEVYEDPIETILPEASVAPVKRNMRLHSIYKPENQANFSQSITTYLPDISSEEKEALDYWARNESAYRWNANHEHPDLAQGWFQLMPSSIKSWIKRAKQDNYTLPADTTDINGQLQLMHYVYGLYEGDYNRHAKEFNNRNISKLAAMRLMHRMGWGPTSWLLQHPHATKEQFNKTWSGITKGVNKDLYDECMNIIYNNDYRYGLPDSRGKIRYN